MNSLRSFYSNVLYAKASNYLTVPTGSSSHKSGGTNHGGGKESKKRRKSSKNSLSNISDNFIRAVENMESVVLIPTKLLDIPVAGDLTIPDLISSGHSNLYEIYKSIKGFKEKLTTLNVTDEDEEVEEPIGGGANIGATTNNGGGGGGVNVDEIIANLTASLSEQGLIDAVGDNGLENNIQMALKDSENNNNLISSAGSTIVTGQIVSNGINGSVPIVTVLKSVPSNGSLAAGDNGGGKTVDNGQQQQQGTNHDSLSMYCDSGVWSSENGSFGESCSRDSSIDDLNESELDPSGGSSPSGRLSVEPNAEGGARSRKPSVTTGGTANRGHYGLQSVQYHRQQIMSAASRYVVKKSLSSAKGFCSFLIELTQVTESVITKYMEEIEVNEDDGK